MSLDVEARDVHLRYCDGTDALRGVSFRVEAGTICGLLGRNGSGKTTLMSLLASLRRPTSGEVLVGGADPFENTTLMAQIALIGHGGGKVHTIDDVLGFCRELRPTWDDAYARRLLDEFDVPRVKTISKLSQGKRAAFAAICGLAARAPLTMLDEPHLGMDAPSRYALYDELLRDYIAHPRTIILSTHHIDEVASLFGELVILDDGELVMQAEADSLTERGTEVIGPMEAVDRFTAGMTVLTERRLGATKAVAVFGDLSGEQRHQATAAGLELGPIPLQDLFVHLTTKEDVR